MTPSPADRPLYRWELVALLALVPVLVAFGWLTVKRSAHLGDRMTDFGVYARAAWAVRTGQSPYDIADDRGWHYLYPPPFVLLLLPLADPPAGADRFGYLPFDVSVGVWYTVNLLLCGLTVHLLALGAVPDARRFSRRWWYARLLPFDFCIGPLGYTLGRGQVNVLILVLIAAGFLALVRDRRFRGGLWLAVAAGIKVLPGLLLLVPLVRRDWRGLLGMIAGGVLFLGVLPVLVWGPTGAVELTRAFASRVVQPSVTNTGDQTIHKEFSGTTSTDSQAFHAVFHAMRYPERATRPDVSDGLSKGLHYLLGLVMVSVTAWAAVRGTTREGSKLLLFVGGLCVVMTHLAPASHMHYYSYSLPLVAGLIADDLRRRPTEAVPTGRTLGVLGGWMLLTAVPLFDTWPFALVLRDYGLAVWANVGLWAWGVSRLAAK